MFDPARWPPALLGTAVGALILLIVLLIGALLLSQARLRRAEGRWSQASRGRNAAAQRGEREAERLLQAHLLQRMPQPLLHPACVPVRPRTNAAGHRPGRPAGGVGGL